MRNTYTNIASYSDSDRAGFFPALVDAPPLPYLDWPLFAETSDRRRTNYSAGEYVFRLWSFLSLSDFHRDFLAFLQ